MDAAIKDYYKILGVKPDASEEQIRERWLELVKQHHPDLESGDIEDERIKEINEAYQVLKQPLSRWEYDLQRTCERELGKSPMRRWAPLCGALILIVVAGGLYLIGSDILSELNSKPTLTMPRVAEEPQNQPVPSKVAKETPVPKATKEAPAPQASKEKGSSIANDKAEKAAKPSTPPVAVEKIVKVQEAMANTDLKKSDQGLPKAAGSPARPTKKVQIGQTAQANEQVSVKSSASSVPVTETKPQPSETKLADPPKPALVASEEEVRRFFDNYTMNYNQKNIEGFLSFFSPRAVQNQTDEYEEIKRVYSRFFRQSTELSYQIEGLKIELYENGAEAKAQFQVNQVLRAGGERKVWKGSIRWVLHKENGALRIISLDYQNQKSL